MKSALADLVDGQREVLLDRWRMAMRSPLCGPALNSEQLDAPFRTLLPFWSQALRTLDPEALDLQELGRLGEIHGRHRSQMGFALDAVIRECWLLQQCVLHLAEEHGVAPTLCEVQILGTAVSRCLEEAARHIESERCARARTRSTLPETWLAEVLVHTGIAVVATDAQDRIVFLNPVAERLTGWAQKDASHLTRTQLLPFRTEKKEAAQAQESSGNLRPAELIQRDGTELSVDQSTLAFEDRQGRLLGSAVVFRDATRERALDAEKQALQVQTQARKAQLEAMLESIPDGVFVGSEAGMDMVNPAALAILGYEDLADLNRSMEDRFADLQVRSTDGDEPVALEDLPFRRALQGESVVRDLRIRNRVTGEDRVVRCSSAPVRVGESVHGAIAVHTDVTDRRKAEQRALQLAQVVEASDNFIALANLDGRTFFINRQGRWLVGLSDTAGERTLQALFAEDSRPKVEAVMARARALGCARAELSFRHFQTGELIPVEGRLFTLVDPKNHVPLWLATVIRDLRPQKKADAERAAQASFERQMIGIVSHDLRNPLSAISLGLSVILGREKTEPRVTTLLHRIRTSTDRALRMVHDLLDFTQARLGGQVPLERHTLDFHVLTRAVVEEVRSAVPERDIRLTTRGLGQGVWDEDRLAQVMTNLLTNALKYSPDGTAVKVATQGELLEVRLEVTNAGPPIPPELLPFIFEPFQRGVGPVDRPQRSVGLGLYIVRSVVAAHGGRVEVTSTEADGTRFTVVLPRTAVAPQLA